MKSTNRILLLVAVLAIQGTSLVGVAHAQEEEIGRFLGGLLNQALQPPPPSAPRFNPGNRPGNNNRFYDDYDDDYYYDNRPQNRVYYTPAPAPPKPAAPAPVKPAENPLPVVQIKPEANVIQIFKGRPITSAEIKAAEAKFNDQIVEHIGDIREALSDHMVDTTQLIATLAAKDVDATTQSQILQAVESNNATQVQILLSSAIKDPVEAQRVSQQVLVKQLLDELQADAEDGALRPSDIRTARNALTSALKKAGAPASKSSALNKPFAGIEEIFKIRDVIVNAVAGSPNAKVNLPSSTCTIVWHPDLPEGEAISLGGDKVMVGTGGRGSLEVSQATVAEAMGVPVRYDEAIPSADYEAVTSGIYLLNPAGPNVAVQYVVDGEKYTLEPGQTKTIATTENKLIKFHRGGSFGEQEYTLIPRTYKFTPTDKGWELYPHEYKVTIDNSENSSVFKYTVDNKQASVPAKETKVHTSNYPIVVRYDRGNGETINRCFFNAAKTETKVAINGTDNLWNLFPAVEGATAAQSFTPAFSN